MKRKALYWLLGACAAVCVALNFLESAARWLFSSFVTFPFQQLGLLIRALSGLGRLGNAAGMLIYAGVCLLPVWFMLRIRTKRRLFPEDYILILLSAAMLLVTWLHCSPAAVARLFPLLGESGRGMALAVSGCAAWSVLAAYVVLRALRVCFQAQTEKLWGYMSALLGLAAFMFVISAFGSGFSGLLKTIAGLKSANSGTEDSLGMSYVFAALDYISDALPLVLSVIAAVYGMDLLREMRSDRYSQSTVMMAQRLARWCRISLAASVLSGMAYNLLQLVFASMLRNVNTNISLPVVPACFVLAMLIFARMIDDSSRLKADNDLFI